MTEPAISVEECVAEARLRLERGKSLIAGTPKRDSLHELAIKSVRLDEAILAHLLAMSSPEYREMERAVVEYCSPRWANGKTLGLTKAALAWGRTLKESERDR